MIDAELVVGEVINRITGKLPQKDEIIPNDPTKLASKALGKEATLPDVIKLIIKYLSRKNSIDKETLTYLDKNYVPARMAASLIREFPEKHTHFIVPLRIYISGDDQEKFDAIQKATEKVAEIEDIHFGFSSKRLKGSIYQSVIGFFNIFKSKAKLEERIEKVEKSLDLNYLQKPQAEIDHKLASAVSELISALSCVNEGAINLGTLVVLKLKGSENSSIVSFNLTNAQYEAINAQPELLKNPSQLLSLLKKDKLYAKSDSLLPQDIDD